MAESALAGLGMGVGLGVAYGTLTEILRTAMTWGKWKGIGNSMAKPLIADVLQKILDAEKSAVHGLTTTGMVDAIMGFIDRTLDFSWMVNEQIASQLFVQMIQQSIAYAIHTSHAGSIGTVCNVYSGSQNLSVMQAESLGQNADLSDRGVKSFLSAGAGMNIPTSAFILAKGANTRIGDVFNRVMGQVDSLLDEWNDLALNYYRQYHTMCRNRLQDALEMKEKVVVQAYGFLEQVANEHLSRISEQLDTLDGAKAWFDASLCSTDELSQISLRINIEREASEDNFDSYKTEVLENIEHAVDEWDSKINQALEDMQDCEYRYSLLIKNIYSQLFSDVTMFARIIIDEVNKTVEDICAYRNVPQAVKIVQCTALGETESSPETEVSFLPYKSLKQISALTVMYECVRIRGIKWLDADVPEEAVKPAQLVSIAWTQKRRDIVVYPYSYIPDVSWIEAT
jgi:hypothetical protein